MRKEVYIPDSLYDKFEEIAENCGFSSTDEALDWAMDAGIDKLFEAYRARERQNAQI